MAPSLVRLLFLRQSDRQGLLDCHRSCFAAGDFSSAARYYVAPLGVYTPENGISVYTSPEDYMTDLTTRIPLARDLGVAEIRGKICAEDIHRENQYRLWVDWIYIGHDLQEFVGSSTIYYCKDVLGDLKIQMVQRLHAVLDTPQDSSFFAEAEKAMRDGSP